MSSSTIVSSLSRPRCTGLSPMAGGKLLLTKEQRDAIKELTDLLPTKSVPPEEVILRAFVLLEVKEGHPQIANCCGSSSATTLRGDASTAGRSASVEPPSPGRAHTPPPPPLAAAAHIR